MIFTKKKFDFDLIVIGSGSAGSVAAHYARSLGKKVAVFEANKLGGDTINVACLPTKALLHTGQLFQTVKNANHYGIVRENVGLDFPSIRQWKQTVIAQAQDNNGESRYKQENIQVIPHKAHFVSPHEIKADGKIYSAAKFLIATGASPYIPLIPGLAETAFITYKQALQFTTPPHRILIYGGGRTACELGQLYVNLGSKVTILTHSERILKKEDIDVSEFIKTNFKKQGINVITAATIIKIVKQNGSKSVYIKREGKEFVGEFDEILVACGKVANLDFSAEKAGLIIKENKLKLKKSLQTNVPHIFAAGDVTGIHQYTNMNSLQSYVAAKNIFSQDKVLPDYSVFPRCLFLNMQVASVGLSEQEAKEKKIKIKKGVAPVSTLDRAITEGVSQGFVKIITNAKGVIIGGTIIAPYASEMIQELTLAIKCRVLAEELADMVHVFPSYSEGIKIACSML